MNQGEQIGHLTQLAEVWADFGRRERLRGAMEALEKIGQPDLAEVMRSAYVEERRRLGDSPQED